MRKNHNHASMYVQLYCIMAERGPKKLVLCGHCDEYVSKRTYYQHRRLYFNVASRKWSKNRVFNLIPDDFVFEEMQTPSSVDHNVSDDNTISDNDNEPNTGNNTLISWVILIDSNHPFRTGGK